MVHSHTIFCVWCVDCLSACVCVCETRLFVDYMTCFCMAANSWKISSLKRSFGFFLGFPNPKESWNRVFGPPLLFCVCVFCFLKIWFYQIDALRLLSFHNILYALIAEVCTSKSAAFRAWRSSYDDSLLPGWSCLEGMPGVVLIVLL